MQAHFQFTEHRQQVENEVDQIVSADYKPGLHKLPIPSLGHRLSNPCEYVVRVTCDFIIKYPVDQKDVGKPPKPTTVSKILMPQAGNYIHCTSVALV